MKTTGEVVRTGPFRSVIRYRCPVGCLWHHDEPTDPGPTPITLPANFTSADLSDAITFEMQHREVLKRDRVEGLVAGHVVETHPDFDETWRP